MEHLTKKLIDKTCERLWTINGSLKGLGGLFTTGARDICFDGEEFYGVGQLLRKLGEDGIPHRTLGFGGGHPKIMINIL